ncbi:uncharacterized protein J5F26_001999 isoform 4-T11 [Ciconia maguari]
MKQAYVMYEAGRSGIVLWLRNVGIAPYSNKKTGSLSGLRTADPFEYFHSVRHCFTSIREGAFKTSPWGRGISRLTSLLHFPPRPWLYGQHRDTKPTKNSVSPSKPCTIIVKLLLARVIRCSIDEGEAGKHLQLL